MGKKVIVVLKTEKGGNKIELANISHINETDHRLKILSQDGPLAEFDKADISSWYTAEP